MELKEKKIRDYCKCPKCGATDSIADFNGYLDEKKHNGITSRKYWGYCQWCGTNLTWWESFRNENKKYEFLGYYDEKIAGAPDYYTI